MHQALFIAYDFPPCRAMGGAVRSAKFVKYLPEFGWEGLVVSLKDDTLHIDEYNSNLIRLRSATPYTKPYHLAPYGWAYNLYWHLKKLLKIRQVQLIYVSCPPFPQAIAAWLLKKTSHLPLIVDFRDAWTINPLVEKKRVARFISQTIFSRLEKRILTRADAFITNTPSMQQAYVQRCPFIQNKMTLIPNGFDEIDFTDNIYTIDNQEMVLLHCGRFSVSGRDPNLLFNSLKVLTAQGCRLKLHLLGEDNDTIQKRVAKFGLEKIVIVTEPIPHKEAILQMYRADILLIYQDKSTITSVSAVAGKTYEYLRTGKPVLAIVPHGDNLDMVKQYAGRYEAVSDYTEASLVQAIGNLYAEWEKGLLPASLMPQQAYLENYNRRALTQKLAQIFDSMIK